MQQSTARAPLDVATDLPWQEQLLIRLDEIVGLLDSIDTRLSRCEGDVEDRGQEPGHQGYSTPDIEHLDTPNHSSVACHLPSATRPLPPNYQTPSIHKEGLTE